MLGFDAAAAVLANICLLEPECESEHSFIFFECLQSSQEAEGRARCQASFQILDMKGGTLRGSALLWILSSLCRSLPSSLWACLPHDLLAHMVSAKNEMPKLSARVRQGCHLAQSKLDAVAVPCFFGGMFLTGAVALQSFISFSRR